MAIASAASFPRADGQSHRQRGAGLHQFALHVCIKYVPVKGEPRGHRASPESPRAVLDEELLREDNPPPRARLSRPHGVKSPISPARPFGPPAEHENGAPSGVD
jgi:hypothetical protein